MMLHLVYVILKYKGRDAKSINVLAENDIISLDGIKENLAYTLVTQREPDNQVQYLNCTRMQILMIYCYVLLH